MKKTFKTIFFTLIIVFITVLSSCSDNAPFNGVNTELGLTVSGGGFDGKSTLISSRVTENINVNEVKEKLSGEQYNDTAELFIYYINVVKNGSTLHPTESISITLPIPTTDYGDFAVFNVTDSKVTRLDFTLTDTAISFNTSSLSYFVIAHSHVHVYTEWEGTEDGINHTRSCPCGYVATEAHDFDEGESTSDTVTTYTCKVCSYSHAHIHEFTSYSNTSDGLSHVKTCSCGNTRTEEHAFGQGIPSSGGISYTCTLCGHLQYVQTVTLNIISMPSDNAVSSLKVNGTDFIGPILLEHGSTVTVEITANEGYKFDAWYENDVLAKNAVFTFTVGEDTFTLGKSEIVLKAWMREADDGSLDLPIV